MKKYPHKHHEPTLLDKLQEFRERCRKEATLTAKGKAWDLEAFDAALERVGYDDAFNLIHEQPRITDRKVRKALRTFGLEMIDEFNKGSEHNSLVALFSAMMVWQQLDPHFQGF